LPRSFWRTWLRNRPALIQSVGSRKNWRLQAGFTISAIARNKCGWPLGLSIGGWSLPNALKAQFVQELRTFEEERHMTYITSVEEVGIEKGRAEGLLEGIALGLELKFGAAAEPVIAEVRQISDLALIEAIMAQIKTASSLDDVRRIYASGSDTEH